jgi:hypothetical protein
LLALRSKRLSVQLPAAINFTHYTHGTGQVRSNTLGNMLSINPERAVSSSLFCKSMVTKPLILFIGIF